MKHFVNINTLNELKKAFHELLKKNHPDNGGNSEIMKEINVEYDTLFPIYKAKAERETGSTINESADSTRSKFYTEFGWEGSCHSWNRTLKEVAAIVRGYVKEKYPTYKFSVRTEYASMCQELHVSMKESPIEIYKSFEEMTKEDKHEFWRNANKYDLWKLNSWNDNEFREEYFRIMSDHKNDWLKTINEATREVVKDIDSFVQSYNYHDCDGRIDYFDVDFYYFGCLQNNGREVKIVPKTPRIKNKKSEVKVNVEKGKSANKTDKAEKLNNGYTYKVKKGEDTRDGSEIWLVRIEEKLDKAAYIAENKAMKERGGYYSKFKHAFLFRFDPSEKLGLVS